MNHHDSSLSRTFFDLPNDNQAESDDFEFVRNLYGSGSLTWERLLQSDRVLIISEAGMGKTYECQAQQRRLFAEGEPAFFIELAALTDAGPELDFPLDVCSRYESWKDSQNERAYFFLDSIDELKLTAHSFERTLWRFASHLGDRLGRACIVLTTRPGSDDREAVARQLPVPAVYEVIEPEELFADVAMRVLPTKKANEVAPTWRFVALAALDEAQQLDLAAKKEVTDPNQLMDAVKAAHAEDFAKRPLDFIELCGDWNLHKEIRGHSEQIENSIGIKLMPRRERKEPAELSPDRAREGAESLALTALLTRRFVIWHGNEGDRSRGDGALDPRKVLSGWSDLEVRTLLERALFGFASYGRVRFHNRSAIEYLAAKRLERLMARGLSSRALHRLLFATSPVGHESIRPTMEPVAAWLAISLESVRLEILRRDPSVLLRFADPGALTVSQRAKALEQYVATYGKGGWRGLHVPALQARRLAIPELGPTINKLWRCGIENHEVRETLLELVEAGRIGACADLAFAAATNVAGDARERLNGLQALAAIDDPRLPSLLDDVAAQHADWPKSLASAIVIHLFSSLTIDQLLGTLRGLSYEKRALGGVGQFLPEAIASANLRPAQLETVRESLTEFIAKDLHWDEGKYRLHTSRQDLVKSLMRTCELQLRDATAHAAIFESIATVLQLAKQDDYYDDASKALRDLLDKSSPPMRRAVFWAQNGLLTAKMNGRAADDRLVRMVWPPSMPLKTEQDAVWLQSDLADPTRTEAERRTALETLLHLATWAPDRITTLKALRPSLMDVPSLAARLEELITVFENPPKPAQWAVDREARQEQQRRKQLKDRASWIQFCRELLAEDDGRLVAKRLNTALNLAEWMARAPNAGNFAGWNRGFLERVFEQPKVERLRQLFMAFWREIIPTLPSERDEGERNVYYNTWRVGLVGLYAEAEDDKWARRLDTAQAKLAMRYALTALTGLPSWVEALSEIHPEVVREMMQPELDAQLNDVAAQNAPLMHYIASTGPETLNLFIGPVRTWLNGQLASGVHAFHRADKFERAMDMVLKHADLADAELIEQAALKHVRANSDAGILSFWLPVLMRLAPKQGVNELCRLAAEVTPACGSPVTQWLAAMFGHSPRHKVYTPALQADADLLSRLALLAYEHVRLEDDEEREGVRESTIRGEAEFARSQLVSWLLDAKGPEAWISKLKFADHERVGHFRDRVVELAKQGMAKEWDAPMYEVSDVLALEKFLDLAPVTRADMAALLRDRLDELEDGLLEDESPREAWALLRVERLLRKGIAGELKKQSNGAYVVIQEAVTSEEKETDLRLRSTSHPIEAVIELKIGENGYTVADLRSALRKQLVGQYMRPEARRVGCLLITIASNKRWRRPQGGRMIDLDEVVELLRTDAARLVANLGYESLLEVRKLDLRSPLVTGRIATTKIKDQHKAKLQTMRQATPNKDTTKQPRAKRTTKSMGM